MKQKLSVTIICFNEENNIKACLDSVKWADEIIVVDSGSTDRTKEIALTFDNVKFYSEKWNGFAKQRLKSISLSNNEWIFAIDADERCSNDLKEEITESIGKNIFNAFKIPRKSYFLGKWVKHCGWYPDYKIRLFKKNSIEVSDRLVHEGYITKEKIGTLKNDLIHYTAQSIKEYTDKVNIYSSLQAQEKFSKKKAKYYYLIFSPLLAFFKSFILKKGILNGLTGLLVSYFHMTTNILTIMKIIEMDKKNEHIL